MSTRGRAANLASAALAEIAPKAALAALVALGVGLAATRPAPLMRFLGAR